MQYCLLFLIIFVSFINQSFGINNLRTLISLKHLENLHNVKITKVLYNDEPFQWVLDLPEGVVINEGGILTREGYILEDTQTMRRDQHHLMRKNRDLNSENPMHFDGRLAVISSPGSENWYHWLLDIIPRLIILKESGIEYDRIFVNNLNSKWQKDSLDTVLRFLNIPEAKLLIINGDVIVQASHLIVPSVPFILAKDYLTVLPVWLKEKLRNIFLNTNLSQVEIYDKVYISRAHASCRRIINESELTNALEKLGFKIVHLESISAHDQARIFNNAKVIIGPHGSGFVNLLFASKGCQLVEIDHGGVDPVRSFYKRMAFLMDCGYHPFYVDQTTEEHLEDDMTVDVPKFTKFLRDKAFPGNPGNDG